VWELLVALAPGPPTACRGSAAGPSPGSQGSAIRAAPGLGYSGRVEVTERPESEVSVLVARTRHLAVRLASTAKAGPEAPVLSEPKLPPTAPVPATDDEDAALRRAVGPNGVYHPLDG
jgi:hypothetical protein